LAYTPVPPELEEVNELFPVNALFEANRGTLVVSMLSVTAPLFPPPVRYAPAVTPVIVPIPAEAHAHAVPVHCNT
jgi:hypothetical protein